ncbi:helix-turn-helix transcriptional regulator [bacterium]|nr:helix-turn-helix transcriptional regulator [bacterium]
MKFSQEELAFRIDSARNYIGCIERGEKIPSVTILLDIANVLHCDIKDLFRNV